jgi:peptide/nickel transport system permease protein
VLAFVVRRAFFAALILVAVSFGSYWFFSRHFYDQFGQIDESPARTWWAWFRRIPDGTLHQPLAHLMRPLGHTAALLACTFLLVVVFALFIGVVSAVRAGSFVDVVLRGFAYGAWAVPAFLLALIIQKVGSIIYAHLGAQPLPLSTWPGTCYIPLTGGFSNADCSVHGFAYAGDVAKTLVLPSIALATSFIGLHARYIRSSLLAALDAPYTVTARAKGLPERSVVLRHALRTSLIAFVSALFLDFGSIFGAAVAVDWIFQLQGLGSSFMIAIGSERVDPMATQMILVVTAALVLVASLLGDIVVSILDPRVRLR